MSLADVTLREVFLADSYEDEIGRLKARIKNLELALKPFAAIAPSSFNAPDGSEEEGYKAYLADAFSNDVDFTGGDLARARAALQEKPKDAKKRRR